MVLRPPIPPNLHVLTDGDVGVVRSWLGIVTARHVRTIVSAFDEDVVAYAIDFGVPADPILALVVQRTLEASVPISLSPDFPAKRCHTPFAGS